MEMQLIEIIGAVLLIVSCISIILLVVSQDSTKGLSQSLTGSSSDSYYQKNSGRTKDALLKKATRTAIIILFVVTLTVNVFALLNRNNQSNPRDALLGAEDVDFGGDFQMNVVDEEGNEIVGNVVGGDDGELIIEPSDGDGNGEEVE
ncbi:MAG: preprotein translocase subunit SecG [Oscillospiraceae bacterium]|nr:preprotein translocase subunit SecG [Oscillospiraceae bacterium]